MEKILTGHEVDFMIRLGLCLVGGLVIGIEREARGKYAGISTQTLVISGSMLFTFMSLHMDPHMPSRIAAQVVTGIGFLGAGIILKSDGGVLKNVTTAASIWFSASVGMAIGLGWYLIGAIAIVYAAIIPRLPTIRDDN
ncbi:MAG: MgtC/SapB family protein [Candidatus Zixiibacteriota bacterium]